MNDQPETRRPPWPVSEERINEIFSVCVSLVNFGKAYQEQLETVSIPRSRFLDEQIQRANTLLDWIRAETTGEC